VIDRVRPRRFGISTYGDPTPPIEQFAQIVGANDVNSIPIRTCGKRPGRTRGCLTPPHTQQCRPRIGAPIRVLRAILQSKERRRESAQALRGTGNHVCWKDFTLRWTWNYGI